MQEPARFQAAIEILTAWLGHEALDKAITKWGRRNRYAGSKDRAAIQDIVYDVVRQKLYLAAQAGCIQDHEITARRLILGYLRLHDIDPLRVFGERPYGPAALERAEDILPVEPDKVPHAWQCNIPPKFWPRWQEELDQKADAMAQAQTQRAGVFLRVNRRHVSRSQAIEALAQEGVESQIHPYIETALVVTKNPRKIAQTHVYQSGLVELQDAHSQGVLAALDPDTIKQLKGPVLDFCAGGGGKSLLAWDLWGRPVHAHDAHAQRLKDLPARARRSKAQIQLKSRAQLLDQYTTILCDVPCSGSGTWRRTPAAKWDFTLDKLQELQHVQGKILSDMAQRTACGGCLIYMTCSVFASENQEQVERFLSNQPKWVCLQSANFELSLHGDGLFVAVMRRES